jgi:predicted flap endonuclease-1-like 5' DNA nuclease
MNKLKLQIKELNCTTGEEIVRDATAEEIAQMELDADNAAARKAEVEAKEAARQAILDRLGLSVDDVKLLLG